MNSFSKEYLFRECVLHRHCIMLRLNKSIQWDNHFVNEIYMVDLCLTEEEKELLLRNFANSIDTYGSINIKAFVAQEEPHNARIINISTSNIIGIQKRII